MHVRSAGYAGNKYSGTSIKGLSQYSPNVKDTIKITSLQRTLCKAPKIYFPIVLIHFHLRRVDNLSTVDKLAGPNVSFIEKFHCKQISSSSAPMPAWCLPAKLFHTPRTVYTVPHLHLFIYIHTVIVYSMCICVYKCMTFYEYANMSICMYVCMYVYMYV